MIEEERQALLEKYSRKNYGSGGDDDYAARKRKQYGLSDDIEFSTRNAREWEKSPEYDDWMGEAVEKRDGYAEIGHTQVWQSAPGDGYGDSRSYDEYAGHDGYYDSHEVYGDRAGFDVAPGHSGMSPEHAAPIVSRPTSATKKRHPIRNVFVVLLLVLLAFGLFNAATWLFKDEAGWAREYAGTWQIKSSGTSGNSPASFGLTLLASSSVDIGKHMTIGIYDGDKGQLQAFGNISNYSFSFNGDRFKMQKDDGTSIEGNLRFGFLVVEEASGTVSVYEKISDEYKPITLEESAFDAAGLLATMGTLADKVGVDPSILNSVDVQQLSEQLSDVPPETIQEAIASVDLEALATGDPAQIIDMSSPAVNEIIENVEISEVVDVENAAENAGALLEQYGFDPDAGPEELNQNVQKLLSTLGTSKSE